MTLEALDHVTIRTANLAGMTEFYSQALGLDDGPRPPFSFAGAWLYCGERAAVHLIEVAEPPLEQDPRIEHFAFRAKGLTGFVGRLRERDVSHRLAIVPGLELRQVHLADPDGNHVEIAFAPKEALPPEPGTQ
jgi:catechol 2,3-dioxygenase-like lactoylglutathione lyase family enzyme